MFVEDRVQELENVENSKNTVGLDIDRNPLDVRKIKRVFHMWSKQSTREGVVFSRHLEPLLHSTTSRGTAVTMNRYKHFARGVQVPELDNVIQLIEYAQTACFILLLAITEKYGERDRWDEIMKK